MDTKPLLNQYSRLKMKVSKRVADIDFLQKCVANRVYPKFLKVTFAVHNSRTEIVKLKAMQMWLKLELKHCFAVLAEYELKLYELHLQLSNHLDNFSLNSWSEFEYNTHLKTQFQIKNIRQKQNEKFANLMREKVPNNVNVKPLFIEGFVENLSSAVFNEDELALLNKGLNFSITPKKPQLVDAVVDIESIIKFKPFVVQNEIRKKTSEVIRESIPVNNAMSSNQKLLNDIRQKDCYYMKADKGNKLVILDKQDYDDRMHKLIADGPYESVRRNPLPKMVRLTNVTIKELSEEFGQRFNRVLHVSNPSIAKMYGLPKIHKTGEKMRPIVSNINAPSCKLSKWFVSEIQKLKPIRSFSVKNTFDFVEKIKDVIIGDDEVLISFDVESLFPSIPIDIALISLDEHLNYCEVPEKRKIIFKKVAKLCMEQNFFQFRETIYEVKQGTCMGNPMSPLIAELFMAKFETELKNDHLLPRIWFRYVDDVYALIKKTDIVSTLHTLNNRYETIKFTAEVEVNGRLPFLDLETIRSRGRISFGVYHKPTSTKRIITADSHSPQQHKVAALHSMVHRMCKLPLSVQKYREEYIYIKEVARLNGYSENLVDKLVKKHAQKVRRSNATTLFQQQRQFTINEERKRVCVSYVPELTNKIKTVFGNNNMQLVFSNPNKLKCLLGSTKDKSDDLSKSGIYAIKCGDCNGVYYGQTRRNLRTRYKEHSSYIAKNQERRSALAEHVLNQAHFNVSVNNMSLVKQVNDERKLDAYESYYIQSDENTINGDNGNIISNLFSLV